MARFDIAIIGTGPAGISAAITAKVRGKNLVLLGSKALSPKLEKAHLIQNYPGLPEVSGAELAAAFRRHLDEMGIEITEGRVAAVYAMGDYFALQVGSDMIEADTVILAAGVSPAATLPGEDALLGRGVSYCATCDAALYRGKTAAVVSYSAAEEGEAEFLAGLAEHVDYFPQYKEEPVFRAANITVKREKPKGVSQEGGKTILATDSGSHSEDGVFILRESISPTQLVPGLAAEGSRVVVDRTMATNLPGLFACGDVTGTPYQYVKSAGEGNVAALSAVGYIDRKKREQG